MTKTIEEAAREFAKDRVGDYDYFGNEYEAYLDGSNDTVEWLFSQPLSQRLTDEEREKIKSIRLKFYYKWLNHQNECSEAVYCAVKSMLESIFGKELFGEELK